jgi:hypothetical protein
VLLSDTTMTSTQKVQLAVSRYQQWWFAHRGLSLDQLRLGPHPLAGSGLSWLGPALPNPAAPAEGTPRPDSETPYNRNTNNPCLRMLDGADPGDEPDSYAWAYKTSTPDGPAPYNCLAWAVNCYTDRWLDTPFTPSNVWERVLTDHGYNVAGGPAGCDGQCPEGKGPKVKIIFHVQPGGTPSDENWVHAMKQEADGDWTSKNGQGPLYENIKDCEKFLDKHYPVPVGQMRVVRCYCK